MDSNKTGVISFKCIRPGCIISKIMIDESDNSQNIDYLEYKFAGEPLSRCCKALSTGFLSDITLVVGEKHIAFQAHKLILAINSHVFYIMFFGSLPEVGPQIEIKDVEPGVFGIFLQFLYSGLFPTNMQLELAINLIGCARKYDVQKIEELTTSYLENIIACDNVIRILETSIFFDLKELEKYCWEFIERSTEEIVRHNSFKTMNQKILEKFLKRENLNIKENILFNEVLRWAKAECDRLGFFHTSNNLRNVLGDCLTLLRLASMTSSEFADGPGKSGLLTDTENANVFMHICSTSKSISDVLFSPIKRGKINSSKLSTCNCIGVQNKCSFCTKGTTATITTTATPSKGSSNRLLKFHTPPCYCLCRIRGKCLADTVVPENNKGSEISNKNNNMKFWNDTNYDDVNL